MSCIIIDDELKSRESLKILIEEFCEGIVVKKLCQNIDEAIAAVQEYKPSIVFLDIQLQRESGFDLLTNLKNYNFEVIFTTAHTEFAIKAFKFSAIDYLLKPIDIDELRKSCEKVKRKINSDVSQRIELLLHTLKSNPTQHYKIALPTSDGLIFVKVSDILYCEAASNYTQILTKDGKKHIVSRTLKEYDEMLSEHEFYRIHNSYLINLNALKRYVRGDGGYVVMSNDISLDVSKRKKEAFLAKLGARSGDVRI